MLANARMLGMNERQLMRHVYWPSALSWMFSSLHTSVGFAVVGAVVGEYLGSAAGLGYLIQQAEGVFDVAGVFAGMFVLAAFVIVIDMAGDAGRAAAAGLAAGASRRAGVSLRLAPLMAGSIATKQAALLHGGGARQVAFSTPPPCSMCAPPNGGSHEQDVRPAGRSGDGAGADVGLAAAQTKVTIAVGGGACLCYLPTVLAKQLGEYDKAGLDGRTGRSSRAARRR